MFSKCDAIKTPSQRRQAVLKANAGQPLVQQQGNSHEGQNMQGSVSYIISY
jgi:hypothetical protein